MFSALLISGITYLLKALAVSLIPVLGAGWAYCITGGACLAAIALIFLGLTLPRNAAKSARPKAATPPSTQPAN